jgi:flagellar hook assembly protein FlgD
MEEADGSRQSAVSSYPNPFNKTTTVEYELEHDATVTLSIYNHLGQEVVVLVNETQLAGTHQVLWNAENLPAGIYFYRILIFDNHQSAIGNRQSTIGKLVKF